MIATPAPPLPQSLPTDPARLKILTWNIWMMPEFTFQSPRNVKRAAAIAEELLKQNFDILCLEKAFDARAREVIWNAMRTRYPFRYGPANNGFSIKVNSGVWILSRIPLIELGETQFRDCAGIECFSRKGAILLRGVFHGHPFRIAATHLEGESGNVFTEARQQVRDLQMRQIRDDLLEKHPEPGVPLILARGFRYAANQRRISVSAADVRTAGDRKRRRDVR
jgi:hypothetical protein